MAVVAIIAGVTTVVLELFALSALQHTVQVLVQRVTELERRDRMTPLQKAVEDLERAASGL